MPQPLAIPIPVSGSRTAIPVTSAGTFAFEFDPESADVSRAQDDLLFEIGGGTVALTGFFSVPDSAMPSLLLPGGQMISAVDLRDALTSDFLTG